MLTTLTATLCIGRLMQAPPFDLTATVKTETIQALIREMKDRYVDVTIAKKLESSLTDWMKSDAFTTATDPAEFAKGLNALLKKDTVDAHLRFRYSASVLPKRERPAEPSAEEMKRFADEVKFVNANFDKVERLRGNIGYIKFNGFATPEDMERPLAGAMKFLANVDAFVIDLRTNGGGDPNGVRLFCSYFFGPKPVHLNDIEFRRGETLTKSEFWTLGKIDGPRFPDHSVYVLTSKRTGSGAEECAYDLQQLKRATIIGEPTWGGANPGGNVRLNDHFACFIPVGRAQNPYSKTNWEGGGVLPDIKADPAQSLKQTHLLALRALIDKATDADHKADLEQIYKEVEATN